MNEWRIIHVGDQHMDTVAPSSRKDDYYEAIQAKFNEIKEISHAEPTAAVIYSGDMINKQDGSRVPYWLTNWLIDHFAHFDEGYQVPSDEETELRRTRKASAHSTIQSSKTRRCLRLRRYTRN
jgi:hypothetical protein